MIETSTRHQNIHSSHPAFRASQQLATHLQQLLVDLTDLHLQGKQAHWNVVGRNFRDLHLQLDEIVDAARNFGDDVAERMRALYVTPTPARPPSPTPRASRRSPAPRSTRPRPST